MTKKHENKNMTYVAKSNAAFAAKYPAITGVVVGAQDPGAFNAPREDETGIQQTRGAQGIAPAAPPVMAVVPQEPGPLLSGDERLDGVMFVTVMPQQLATIFAALDRIRDLTGDAPASSEIAVQTGVIAGILTLPPLPNVGKRRTLPAPPTRVFATPQKPPTPEAAVRRMAAPKVPNMPTSNTGAGTSVLADGTAEAKSGQLRAGGKFAPAIRFHCAEF